MFQDFQTDDQGKGVVWKGQVVKIEISQRAMVAQVSPAPDQGAQIKVAGNSGHGHVMALEMIQDKAFAAPCIQEVRGARLLQQGYDFLMKPA